MNLRNLLLCAAILAAGTTSALAWNYPGHRMVNQVALASLPADFPAFVHEPATAERITFLAGEPDRWRNLPDLPLKQYNGLDHYINLEILGEAGLDADQVPDLRYEFAREFAAGRAAHPDNFAPIDPAKNADHEREWPGFLPWAITEYYGKLKSAFSYLKTFEQHGTPEEVANAQANVVYVMGVMGHYVGDGSQPMHTTIHHHGWVGDNPHHYSTAYGFHEWIDGGFIAKANLTWTDLQPQVKPAQALDVASRADGRDPVFVATMKYLEAQNALVEPLYALEAAGKLDVKKGVCDPAGRAFIEGQLLKGGEMLGAIWLTAWRNARPDSYLSTELAHRAAAQPAR
ncbi:MAG: hypothetical protein ACHQ5A_02480 [Opitutales bacterium]